ncbi:formamidopyrimidine-DNA glycosylase [Pseudonocardia ailaonensis]|uniref:Formamidopyrimidine-DNA glycosylase n=1 Tax=Pseudonocardia ailaonensis TaxID=367279 RepID=A0ABN2N6I6_9PSEU
MPELPEVESARVVLERSALGRRIEDVDDSDTYVCRPHPPGELRAVLVGSTLRTAHRRGKSLWCTTSEGSVLGIHLGMSGKVVVASADGTEVDGGDHWEFGRAPGDYRHSRFSLAFADGGALHLVDPRRLGRVRLDPPVDTLGPDAAGIDLPRFLHALGHGRAPVKARLLDQHALAGIGNLLADDLLWRAGLNPARPVDSLTGPERVALHRSLTATVDDALRGGGVHTLPLVAHRRRDGRCPTDGAALVRSTVGGRTTYWCPRHQPRLPPPPAGQARAGQAADGRGLPVAPP